MRHILPTFGVTWSEHCVCNGDNILKIITAYVFFFFCPGNRTAQSILWMVGAGGSWYVRKVLVRQDEKTVPTSSGP